jgi:hypothetical protein
MGSISKLINDLDGAKDDEKEQKERLETLLMLAKAKIQQFREQLDEGFANPGLVDKTQIPGTRSIRYIEQYHVASKTEFNSQVTDHLDHAIDAFFSIGDGNNKDAVKEGLKQVIQTGLAAFIGSTEVGETQDKMYFVVPENNAFVRIDVICWKYHFEQTKILSQSDTAVAYVLCKSVIDHKRITLDELIYLVTQALSSGEYMDSDFKNSKYVLSMDAASKKPTNVQTVLTNLGILDKDHPSQGLVDYLSSATNWKSTDGDPILILSDEAAATPDTRKTMSWGTFVSRVLAKDVPRLTQITGGKHKLTLYGQIDGASAPIRSTPAQLSVVEGYIDEMVRVWKKLDADR